jgi:ankyrin repeat protein
LLPASVVLFAVSFAIHASSDDPWTQALLKRDLATIERLVEQGSDVGRASEDGHTALMLAANKHHPPLVRTLLERGARVNAANSRGGTALMYAATTGDLETVGTLLEHGADVNARAANGWTALTLASARGFEGVVSALLAHDADPDIADVYGWTPLMRAVEQDRAAVVRVLLAAGRVDANARNDDGHTALHRAAVLGFSEIADLFVTHGADVHVRDTAGRTPAMLAKAQGHTATAEIISRAATK